MSSFNFREDISWRDILLRSAIVLATVAIIVWLMPRDGRNYFYAEQGKPGKYADFTAPFDFPIYKSEEARKAKAAIEIRTKIKYNYNELFFIFREYA